MPWLDENPVLSIPGLSCFHLQHTCVTTCALKTTWDFDAFEDEAYSNSLLNHTEPFYTGRADTCVLKSHGQHFWEVRFTW